MRCPNCGSGNISLSPSTGALCAACDTNFDPKHGLPDAGRRRPQLGGLGQLTRAEAPESGPERPGW